MGVWKTFNHIKIQISIPNSTRELPVSSKTQNQDLKDMDFLCTWKIKIQSQNLDHGCIKDKDDIQIKTKITKPQVKTEIIWMIFLP